MAYLDDYEGDKKKRRVPIPLIVGVLLVAAAGVGALVLTLLRTPSEPEPEDVTGDATETVTIVDNEEASVTTGDSDIVGGVPVEIEDPDLTPSEDDVDQGQLTEEDEARMYENSSAISAEEKALMLQDNEIDEHTEEKYAQYGALNIDRMSEVARNFVTEWTQMVNDSQWDAHSTVLKSMIDIDYVKNHSEEFQVKWLYECVVDSLYVSKESMTYNDIADIQIINSVPSPLTYVSITVNTTINSVEGGSPSSITYQMALNKNYQVCRFAPSY